MNILIFRFSPRYYCLSIGLKQNDINQLTSYFHFREGFNINSRTLAERAANFDETIDIFETIATDEPQGNSLLYFLMAPQKIWLLNSFYCYMGFC